MLWEPPTLDLRNKSFPALDKGDFYFINLFFDNIVKRETYSFRFEIRTEKKINEIDNNVRRELFNHMFGDFHYNGIAKPDLSQIADVTVSYEHETCIDWCLKEISVLDTSAEDRGWTTIYKWPDIIPDEAGQARIQDILNAHDEEIVEYSISYVLPDQ